MTEQEKNPAQEVPPEDDGTMSLTDHLAELRSRLIKALLAIAVGGCVAWFFLDEITNWMVQPVGKLYYMKPGEAFFTYLKIDIAAGFLIALPVIFYHAWQFFLPAMTRGERAVLGILVPASVLLFFTGLAFSFFLIMPTALKFFMGFGMESENLQTWFSFGSYFDFVIMFVLPFGFVFELPLVIIVAAKLGILTSEWLGKYRRYVFFFSFVIGALVTSPDVITQIAVAIPVILLYEVGYLVVKYILRR